MKMNFFLPCHFTIWLKAINNRRQDNVNMKHLFFSVRSSLQSWLTPSVPHFSLHSHFLLNCTRWLSLTAKLLQSRIFCLKKSIKKCACLAGCNYFIIIGENLMKSCGRVGTCLPVPNCCNNNGSLKNQYPVDRYPYSLDCFLSLSLSLIAQRKT